MNNERADLSEVDLFELWNIAWANKWLIGGITAGFAVFSVLYALSLPNYFRAETVLMQAQEDPRSNRFSAFASQLAGLGGGVLGAGSNLSDEALEVLRSREFTEDFIVRHGVMQTLFAEQWSEETGTWISDDPESIPTPWTAFKRLRDLRTIEHDKATGILRLSMEWTDPEVATRWVNSMVTDLNQRMQAEAIAESERNREFLESQIAATNVVEMQRVLYGMIENEVQTAMLAHGRSEYAFKIVGRALVPQEKSRPSRAIICIFLTLFGGIVAVMVAFVRHAYQRRHATY